MERKVYLPLAIIAGILLSSINFLFAIIAIVFIIYYEKKNFSGKEHKKLMKTGNKVLLWGFGILILLIVLGITIVNLFY